MSLLQVTLFFIVVVAINSAAVYAQRRYRLYTRLLGRHNWHVHVILLSVIWAAFLIALFLMRPPSWKLSPVLRPFGIAVAAVGIWLVVTSWARLGTAGVCNGWFFGRGPAKQIKGGVFRLSNPMYTSFILLFIGVAFWLENASYLWLAAVSFVLLNIIQARIEKPIVKNYRLKAIKIYGRVDPLF